MAMYSCRDCRTCGITCYIQYIYKVDANIYYSRLNSLSLRLQQRVSSLFITPILFVFVVLFVIFNH